MKKDTFQIIAAAKAAYRFAGREWRYLAALGLLPAAANFGIAAVLRMQENNPGMIESFLWDIPATVLSGWFMFQIARLLVFGERIDKLPKDPAFTAERHRMLQASVLMWVLFDLVLKVSMSGVYQLTQSTPAGETSLQGILGMILFGAVIWGLRFSVAHLLAAVGYPIRDFARNVTSAFFPLRLLGLAAAVGLPVMLAMGFVLYPMAPNVEGQKIASESMLVILFVASAGSVILTALLSSAAVFALKEMLGKGGKS
jgi:hypothetical protein